MQRVRLNETPSWHIDAVQVGEQVFRKGESVEVANAVAEQLRGLEGYDFTIDEVKDRSSGKQEASQGDPEKSNKEA